MEKDPENINNLEITKSSVTTPLTDADVWRVINKVLDEVKGNVKFHTGTKLSEYERNLTARLYEALNADPQTKCPQNRQIWGVFVGNNFCSMWLPPKDSIRIHAKTDRVSIYLFRF